MFKLTRHPANPILAPTQHWWERKSVFNPGVTIYRGKVVLLYRAIGDDNISRLGYAESSDGIHFRRFDLPRYDSPIDDPYERLGAEDPRITRMDHRYYMLYTAVSVYSALSPDRGTASISTSKNAPFRIRVGVTTTRDFKRFVHREVLFGGLDTKNATLFPGKVHGNYYIVHRVHPNIALAKSSDFRRWRHQVIAAPRPGTWDSRKIGVGAPPIKTHRGWLLFTHGVDDRSHYHLGILVLDRHHPERILYRSQDPILSPEATYEQGGLIHNVVYTCGAIVWKNHYYVYYGAGDTVIGLATIPIKVVDQELEKALRTS